jgi:hypothetical protein
MKDKIYKAESRKQILNAKCLEIVDGYNFFIIDKVVNLVFEILHEDPSEYTKTMKYLNVILKSQKELLGPFAGKYNWMSFSEIEHNNEGKIFGVLDVDCIKVSKSYGELILLSPVINDSSYLNFVCKFLFCTDNDW